MDFSKLKNKLLICLCCVVLILPFYLITFTYAADNTINGTVINGIGCDDSHNYFFDNSSSTLTYYPVKKGFLYTINRISDNPSYIRISVYSSSRPSVNVPYTKLTDLSVDNPSFDYLSSQDGYISIVGNTTSSYTVTEKNINVMNDAVSGLVDNVGVSNIWNIFDISINYIVVVVLVAFGIYIIFRLIRKVSRGKEGL